MRDGRQVGEVTDYEGYEIRVTERWKPGEIAGSETQEGYRVEWQHKEQGPASRDGMELFGEPEQARRYAEKEIARKKQTT